jgi:hypothetical protein
MDGHTLKVLADQLFKKLDQERVEKHLPYEYFLENEKLLDGLVRENLVKLGCTFTPDEIVFVIQHIWNIYKVFCDTEEDEEEDLMGTDLELDVFLSGLEDVSIDVEDLFATWNEFLARSDILEIRTSILSDLNALLTEIYNRKQELEDLI